MKHLLFFCISCWVFCQDETPADFSIIESFSVQAGFVDVVVTDKQGNRVKNLKQGAFTLQIDGKPIELTTFDEIQREDLLHLNTALETKTIQTPETQEAPQLGTNYLVFVDDWFTKRQFRGRLLKQIKREVAAMSAYDRVAIVRYQGKQLETILAYTSDKTAINQALTRLNKMPSQELARHTQILATLNPERRASSNPPPPPSSDGVHRPTRIAIDNRPFLDEATLIQAIVASVSAGGEHSVKNAIETYAEQVQKSADAMELAMRGFHQKEGRNSLLLVSEGFTSQIHDTMLRIPGADDKEESPTDPITDERAIFVHERQTEGARFFNQNSLKNPRHSVKQITETANLLGYTIYPVLLSQINMGTFMNNEVNAFNTPSLTGYEYETRYQTANLLGYTIYPVLLSQINMGTFMNNEVNAFNTPSLTGYEYETRYQTAKTIAEETGGIVLGKAHRQKLAFTQVMADQQHYYRMSFVLPEVEDNHAQKIEVQIDGDYELRHRKAFRQRSETERKQLITQAAMLSSQGGRLIVNFGEAIKQDRRKQRLPFELTIPTDWLTVLKDGDQFNVHLELTVAAMDKQGNQSPMLQAAVNFSGQGNPTGDAYYDGQILLRKKPQRLVFALHDKTSNESISQTIDYRP